MLPAPRWVEKLIDNICLVYNLLPYRILHGFSKIHTVIVLNKNKTTVCNFLLNYIQYSSKCKQFTKQKNPIKSTKHAAPGVQCDARSLHEDWRWVSSHILYCWPGKFWGSATLSQSDSTSSRHVSLTSYYTTPAYSVDKPTNIQLRRAE